MNRIIKIGTRDSALALWQAETVASLLQKQGIQTELVPVKSTGDIILDKPLYELGITGIFTKTLDVAMISGQVDLAVHSMKDVPTQLPKGIVQAAVLPRASVYDILVHKGLEGFENTNPTIATGSLRRRAQWLHKYPHHQTVDLRGNVQTRLQKLNDNDWAGAIFAEAGLDRVQLKPENYQKLDWMIPAPAQGAMLVVGMAHDAELLEVLHSLNDAQTATCVQVERAFLRKLEGGCTAPIGAYAFVEEQTIHFHGALFSLDGKQKLEVKKSVFLNNCQDFGELCAIEVLQNGGEDLMKHIRTALQK